LSENKVSSKDRLIHSINCCHWNVKYTLNSDQIKPFAVFWRSNGNYKTLKTILRKA